METKPPTIKGLFVNSHIKRVKQELGKEGLAQLQNQMGTQLHFWNWSNIPVRQEVDIINATLRLLRGQSIPPGRFDYEAGRLHFENFMTTPFAKTIFNRFGTNFMLMMQVASRIAGGVFRGVTVRSEKMGEQKVRITMENMDYPLEHFTGFFEAWLSYMNLLGIARAKKLHGKIFEYTITWKEAT